MYHFFPSPPEIVSSEIVFAGVVSSEVVFAEVDSGGLRARVKVRVKVKLLLNERIDERELLLYFERDSVDDPWYMVLEDSLRELTPDSTKQN